MENIELTILMPCLNEAETLGKCIDKAKIFLQTHCIRGEVLIADNGSTDASQTIAKTKGARVLLVENKGYGAALKTGIKAAQGRYIIMGDADDSYNFLHLMPFLIKLREGNQLVMGNRFKGGILAGAMPPLNRYLGNPILSFLGRTFFKNKIGDFHCGLRGFCRASFSQLEVNGEGMEFASEMIVKATLQKFKITEVPIQLYPDGRSRLSHLRPWRDGWRHLRLLLLFCPRWLFFYPGLILLSGGIILLSILSFSMMVIGKFNLDIHTMLFASIFIVLGLQAISFSILANFVARIKLKLTKPKFYDLLTLEHGLILGALLILCGCAGSIYSVWFWIHHSFGPLIPTKMMRILIPSMTALISGFQIIFTSFFFGLLKLHVDH